MNIVRFLWARDKNRAAVACDSLGLEKFKAIEIVDMPDGRVLARAPGDMDGVFAHAFRPDGEALVLDVLGRLSLWDLHATTVDPFPGFPDRDIPAKEVVSPDWRFAGRWSEAHEVVIASMKSGAVVARLSHAFKARPYLAWSADGAAVVTVDADAAIEVWHALTGKRMRLLPAPPGQSSGQPTLTTDGSKVFFTRASTRPNLDAETLSRVSVLDVASGRISGSWAAGDFTTSANGSTLFLSEPGHVRRVEIASGKTRVLWSEVVDLTEFRTQSYLNMDLSPDGRWLTGIKPYVGGNTLLAIDAATGERASWADGK